jgi:predicted PurR-regulated permease PerM
MALIDSRTTRILFTVLVFAVGFAFLYVARRTLIAFLFAVFFAYLVDPAVSHVEKFARSRAAAITVIYLLIVLLLGTLFFFIGPRIGHEVQKLTESMPSLMERINSGQIVQDIGIEHGLTKNTRDQLSAFLKAHTGDLLKVAQRAGLRVAEAAQESWILVIIPILAAFFLKDGRVFSQVALSFVHSKPQREFLQGVINDMNLMLAQFIRAQLTLAALSWVAYASFLGLIMHVPYALMLGTAGGILEFIPVVGPLVASFLIIGVALLNGYQYWLIVGIFLIIW